MEILEEYSKTGAVERPIISLFLSPGEINLTQTPVSELELNKINTYGFILVYFAVGIVVVYKALYIPITHDETATTFFYVNCSVWEIMMFPDNWPSNHILNTLSVKLLKVFFNLDQVVVRIPSLISYIIYAIGVYRILKRSLGLGSKFFLAGALLFISNAYLLDFFSLSRGYGMASAWATLSVSYMLEGFQERKTRAIWIGFGLSFLASYANFTLLVFWCTIIALTGYYFVFHERSKQLKFQFPWKKLTLVAASVLAYFVLIFTPLYKMQSTDQFVYWEKSSFKRSTMNNLVDDWRGQSELLRVTNSNAYSNAIIIFLVLAVIYILYKYYKHKKVYINFNVALGVLLFTVFVNVMQTFILGTPNLIHRTALFYYPLFVIVFIQAFAFIEEFKIKWLNWFLSLFFVSTTIAYLCINISLRQFAEWDYDQDTTRVIRYLESKNKDVTLKTNWIFHPSFKFYKYTGKTPFINLYAYDKQIDKETDADYYYVLDTDTSTLGSRFVLDKKFSDDRLLMRRVK